MAPKKKPAPAVTTGDRTPALACIVTAYNEGKMASLSLDSILSQSFGDFEVYIVDDGASEATREVVRSYKDDRITHIRQSNDGPSSARNRALNVAKADYVCFLDADDTRPPWAFATMVQATESKPDCVFSPGALSELRCESLPFYDTGAFDALAQANFTQMASDDPKFMQALRHVICIEPQSANKCVKRSFIKDFNIRYPNGMSFFEDSNFHMAVLMNMESFATTELPTFTYFRRYGEPRLTDSSSTSRFDAFGSIANVLHLFALSRYFHDPVLRKLVLASCFRVLEWGESSISLDLKYNYRQALRILTTTMDSRYLKPLDEEHRQQALGYAPWVGPALQYVRQAVEHA